MIRRMKTSDLPEVFSIRTSTILDDVKIGIVKKIVKQAIAIDK